jgi:predicted PurR-regulated permease PerM
MSNSEEPVAQHPNPPSAAEPVAGGTIDHGRMLRRGLPVYYALLLAILTVVAIYLIVELRDVLVLLFISLLFAAAAARPAAWLARFRIPLGIAVIMVYLAVLAVIVGIGWLVVPPLLSEVAAFGDNLPHYIERLERVRATYDDLQAEYSGLESFEAQAASAGARILEGAGAWATGLPGRFFRLFLDLLAVLIISTLLVTSRRAILNLTLSLIHPGDRDEWASVISKMWRRLGHYLRAKVIVMAIIGAITYVALLLIGLPYAIPLSIVVALGQLIPRAGPWLARIPLLLIALLQGWPTFVITFAASIVIENLKGSFISPFVEGNQLNIHPLLVFVSVLVGSSLLGVAGAFIAVPAAAMIQVVFEDVIIPWRYRQLGNDMAPATSPAPAREVSVPPPVEPGDET